MTTNRDIQDIPSNVAVSDFTSGGDRLGIIPLRMKQHAWDKLKGRHGKAGFYQKGIAGFGGYSAAQVGNASLNVAGFGERSQQEFHHTPGELAGFFAECVGEILAPNIKELSELESMFQDASGTETYRFERRLSEIKRGTGRTNPALFFHHMNTHLNGAKFGDLVRPHVISAQSISSNDSLLFTNRPITKDHPPFQIYEPNQSAALLVVAGAAHPYLFPSIPVTLENSNIGEDQVHLIDGGFFDSDVTLQTAMDYWYPGAPQVMIHWDCGYVTQTFSPDEYDSLTSKSMLGRAFDLWKNQDIWFSTLRELTYGRAKSAQKHAAYRLAQRGDGSRMLSVTFNINEYLGETTTPKWLASSNIINDEVIQKIEEIANIAIEDHEAKGTMDQICDALEQGRIDNQVRELQANLEQRRFFDVTNPDISPIQPPSSPLPQRDTPIPPEPAVE